MRNCEDDHDKHIVYIKRRLLADFKRTQQSLSSTVSIISAGRRLIDLRD